MALTTHVLDTMHGCPAAGMQIQLYTHTNLQQPLQQCFLNQDGRCPTGTLLQSDAFKIGRYRLIFSVQSYFFHKGVVLPEPAFLEDVILDFGVSDDTQHYHVPLLVSPWSYATYRGS